jgi:hypothetical protein
MLLSLSMVCVMYQVLNATDGSGERRRLLGGTRLPYDGAGISEAVSGLEKGID